MQANGHDVRVTTLLIVSHVRVVTSLPNVFSIRTMKAAPFGLGTYAVKTARLFMHRIRAPSTSIGSGSRDRVGCRKKVTTRFEPAGSLNAVSYTHLTLPTSDLV